MMLEYKNVSIEEIRMDDYRSSGGFFGSPFATLGALLCRPGSDKTTPYAIGQLYQKIAGNFTANQEQDKGRILPTMPVKNDELERSKPVLQNSVEKSRLIEMSFTNPEDKTKRNVVVSMGSEPEVTVRFSTANGSVDQTVRDRRRRSHGRSRHRSSEKKPNKTPREHVTDRKIEPKSEASHSSGSKRKHRR